MSRKLINTKQTISKTPDLRVLNNEDIKGHISP